MHSKITNNEPSIDAGLIQSNVYHVAVAFAWEDSEKKKGRFSEDIPHEITAALEKKQKQEPIKTPLEDAFDTAGRNKKCANSNFGVQREKKQNVRVGYH